MVYVGINGGRITHAEFASTIVKTLELPNKKIEDTAAWDAVNLKIKPLELILDILSSLANISKVHAYLTPFELIRIIIPLAGNKASVETHAKAIIAYRFGRLDISYWPDCAPGANDKRMAREFLLFLSHYGFCARGTRPASNMNEKYYLQDISPEEILELKKIDISDANTQDIIQKIRISEIPTDIERKRVSRSILERPYQNRFRKNVLMAYNNKCLVTGVDMENVLEAAHIKPVEYNGSDSFSNGICLRSDIHQLFDSNNLRILPSGDLLLSENALKQNNYYSLPKKIVIPNFVNDDLLNWRMKYY